MDIDLKVFAQELQEMLQGTWKYGCAGLYEYSLRSPIFTREGELVMRLLPDAKAGVPLLQVNGRPGSRAFHISSRLAAATQLRSYRGG